MGCGSSSPPNTPQSYEEAKEIEQQEQRATTIQEMNSTLISDTMDNKSLSKPTSKTKNVSFFTK
jgi:hypothetical protein